MYISYFVYLYIFKVFCIFHIYIYIYLYIVSWATQPNLAGPWFMVPQQVPLESATLRYGGAKPPPSQLVARSGLSVSCGSSAQPRRMGEPLVGKLNGGTLELCIIYFIN